MSDSGNRGPELRGTDGAPLRSKDWQARMRHDRTAAAATPSLDLPAPDHSAETPSKARRKITRLELGTFANDLEAAAAFLGRNRKSLGDYLVDGIAERYGQVLDVWAARRAFPIDLPYERDVIGGPAFDAIHQLRAGNPHIAGPIAAYALDAQAKSYHTGMPNHPGALQTFFLRTVVALSWVTNPNPNRLAALSGSLEGIPALAALHHEVVAVIETGQHRRGVPESEPWFYLHELTAGFVLCYELLKIVCNMFVPPAENRDALTREEQRRAAREVLSKYAHYQLADVTRLHSSSRMQWNFVQLATVANQAGEIDPLDTRPAAGAILEARMIFIRGIAQLRRNYGRHFPAIKRFLDQDEDTGPLLRQLGYGELKR